MNGPGEPEEVQLRARAREYVRGRHKNAGGWRQAVGGLWHKTGPAILGTEKSLSIARLSALFVRVLLFAGNAFLPIVVRKVVMPVVSAEGTAGGASGGVDALLSTLLHLDGVDIVLASAWMLFTGVPKLLDARAKTRDPTKVHSPHSDLAAAIEKMPSVGAPGCHVPLNGGTEEALRHCLGSLRLELSELIGDENQTRLTDVTLLEFCDNRGQAMQVRARTANEETHRPKESWRFLAYYVAMQGRWFAEHDFAAAENPFPNERLTVKGGVPINYRSVLYLPITTSTREPASNGAPNGANHRPVTDYCIGVICVHSARPYRFWRWGDHNKLLGGMGDVAYKRSLPYIALISRLLEHSVPKVRMEVL